MARFLSAVRQFGNVFFGGFGDDKIDGNDDDNRIFAGFGNDTVKGFGGRDLIFGGFGKDKIDGGEGKDRLSGGFGDDHVSGGGGDDHISGGFGNDVLVGNKGDDTVRGGFGDDLLIWNNGDGSDLLDGGFGHDRVQVNFNTDLVNDDLANDDVVEISGGRKVNLARTELNGQTEVGLFELDIRRSETLEVNGGGGSDTFKVQDNVASYIDLELDGGADVEGAQGFTLVNTVANGVSIDAGGNTADLDAVLAQAEAGEIYFNAHSTDFPAGEARGQLTLIRDTRDENGVGEVVFGARLDGDQEVQDPPVVTASTGQGAVTFIVDETGVVSYEVSLTVRGVTLDELTVLHLHNAPAGANGPVVVDLLADAGVDPATPIADREFDGTGFTANDLGDTLDLSEFAEGVFVDLDETNGGGTALDENGQVRNFATASGGEETFRIDADDFEDARGTAFDDRLFGNAQNNVLEGLEGNDTFHAFGGDDVYDGGEGTDTALFVQAVVDVVADLEAGIAIAGDQVNELISIENFVGGANTNDFIAGSAGVNKINGNGGDDVIVSRGANDVTTGGAGSDGFGFADGDSDGAEEITDFALDDRFILDADSFGVDGELTFQSLTAVDGVIDPAEIDTDANVYVVQGLGAATAVRDALATALLEAEGETEGAQSAFFLYFNEGQNRNRLFEVEDIDQVGGSLQHIANLGDGTGDTDEALALLGDVTADNFVFDNTLVTDDLVA